MLVFAVTTAAAAAELPAAWHVEVCLPKRPPPSAYGHQPLCTSDWGPATQNGDKPKQTAIVRYCKRRILSAALAGTAADEDRRKRGVGTGSEPVVRRTHQAPQRRSKQVH